MDLIRHCKIFQMPTDPRLKKKWFGETGMREDAGNSARITAHGWCLRSYSNVDGSAALPPQIWRNGRNSLDSSFCVGCSSRKRNHHLFTNNANSASLQDRGLPGFIPRSLQWHQIAGMLCHNRKNCSRYMGVWKGLLYSKKTRRHLMSV